MTLQAKLERIGTGLAAALAEGETKYCDVFHYWRPQLKAPFCVWAEDGEYDALNADDRKKEQGVSGYVDYYTKVEYDPALDVIQDTLNSFSFPFGWSLYSVQYEDETNLIHYQWTWTVV